MRRGRAAAVERTEAELIAEGYEVFNIRFMRHEPIVTC